MLYTSIYWLCFFFVWRKFSRSSPEPWALSVLSSLLFHFSSPFTTSKLAGSTGSHLHREACHTLSRIQSPRTTSQKMLKTRRCFHLVLSSAIQKAQIPHVPVLAKHHHKYLGYHCTVVTTVDNLNTRTRLAPGSLCRAPLPPSPRSPPDASPFQGAAPMAASPLGQSTTASHRANADDNFHKIQKKLLDLSLLCFLPPDLSLTAALPGDCTERVLALWLSTNQNIHVALPYFFGKQLFQHLFSYQPARLKIEILRIYPILHRKLLRCSLNYCHLPDNSLEIHRI